MAAHRWRGSSGKVFSLSLSVHTDLFHQVKPFVKKLGESGGLQELVLKGVKHIPTQEQLRSGLLKAGGVFRVVN